MNEADKWTQLDKKIKNQVHPTPKYVEFDSGRLMFIGPDGNLHSAHALTEGELLEDYNPDWSSFNLPGKKI